MFQKGKGEVCLKKEKKKKKKGGERGPVLFREMKSY